MTILICDDSRFTRQRITDYLSGLDCTLIQAENGKMALEKIVSEKPDLMFLDLLMPDLDGFGVLEELKKSDNLIPVVIISADIQNTTVERCISLGAKAFLNKPPQKEALIKMACQILNIEGAR